MRKLILLLALCSLCVLNIMAQAPVITQISPAPNTTAAASSENITITWNTALASTTANANNIKIWGSRTPSLYSTNSTITLSSSGSVITIDPADNFRAGEQIFVSVQTGIQSTSGTIMTSSQTWSFFAAAQGDGFFNPDLNFPQPNDATYDMAPGDVDGDGDIDIVRAEGSDEIHLYRNNGDGTFTYSYEIDDRGLHGLKLLLADFDNDGDLDLAAADAIMATIYFYKNNGAGIYSFHNDFHLAGNQSPKMTLYQADFNGDGLQDILVGQSFVTNYGNFSFYVDNISTSWDFSAAGDIDGDLDQDIVVCNDEEISLYLNNRYASFSVSGVTTATYASGTTRIRLSDMDNDGDLDIVYSSQDANTGILLNNGTATSFTDQILSTIGFESFNVGDFNGDGKIDIVGAEDSNREIFIILNSGSTPYSDPVQIGCYNYQNYGFSIADVNVDSKPDVLAFNSGYLSNTINVFINSLPNNIQFSTSSVVFTSTAIGTPATNSLNIAFATLAQNLTLESQSTHFTVSVDNVNFAATTTISTTATSPQTIYVRFLPFEVGTHSSVIKADLGCFEYSFSVSGEGAIGVPDGLVLNNLNDGPGSLRYALENATSGTVITFAGGIGSTFTVTGSPIIINYPLNINFQSLIGGGNIVINSGSIPAIQFDCGSQGTVISGVFVVSSHPSRGVVSTCPDIQVGKIQAKQITVN